MDENTDPYHLVFFRNGAEEYILHLEEMASIALATDLLSPEERNNLKRSLDQLRSSFDKIKKFCTDQILNPRPADASFFYQQIWLLSSSAFLIGSHATITNSSQKFTRIQQAKIARKGLSDNSLKARILIDAIKKEIEAVKPKHAFAVSEKFADIIRPGVLRGMNIEESIDERKWPSVSTIKAKLKLIREGKA